MSRVLRVAMAITTLFAAGCTIRPDSSPRDVAPDQRGLDSSDAASAGTSGAARIYLVTPNEPEQRRQLSSVQRDVPTRPETLLQSLLGGPNQEELDERLVTAIPNGTQLISARSAGDVLFVDVTQEITELTGEALVLAVAQIVYTASEIDGVQAIRLRVEGEDQAWPKGDGQTEEGPLSVYDFPGLVQSSQPDYPAVPSPS